MLFAPKEKGQGLVEYALILVLVAVVVIVILAILGPTIGVEEKQDAFLYSLPYYLFCWWLQPLCCCGTRFSPPQLQAANPHRSPLLTW